MRITKEKFNELKQLDRIEFRQKYNLITKNRGSFTTLLMYLSGFLGIFTLIIINIILNINYHEGENAALEFAKSMSSAYSIIPIVFIFIILLGFISWLIRNYNLIKLEQEYFTEEIKIKK
jgi:uncharacterized BrkB/YihY/UPF0761 family membrane protein